MTIEQLQERKAEIEAQIAALINGFRRETGMGITRLAILHPAGSFASGPYAPTPRQQEELFYQADVIIQADIVL